MLKVLIVEDEKQIAEYLQKYIEIAGYQTSILNNGAQVLSTIKRHRPNLVILDIFLPQKDGISCCKDIRKFSDVPIILLSAQVREIDRIIGLQAGADDYVCKPFSAKELVLRVQAILKRANHSNGSSITTLSPPSAELSA
jgi:two-component system, OmpR family, response regulator BaeR